MKLPPPPAHPRTPSASFASVESVKAASDVYLPVSGTIKAVNSALTSDPAAVNQAAESSAWFARVTLADAKELDGLLDAAAYKAACDAEKH
jgi:glycine cleavage system H protein